ncbi:MAG TPA: site-specific integrase [Nitrososphaerales archaeon]|nr:site-specific integrase [Nitrososphaerales archaeon]
MQKAELRFEGESVREFLKGFRSEATRESYSKKLRHFLEYVGMSPDEFLAKTRKDPHWAEHMFIDYVEARRNQVSGSTISQVRDALKRFHAMNDFEDGINWSKITRMMPRARKIGSDRAPTMEEVRKIVDNADHRMKCIILLLCSSGIRVGAIDYLTWRDVEPVTEAGETVAARLTVYRRDAEEYQTFITPECYRALLDYRRRREAIGEKVVPTSPLIRDMWDDERYRPHKNEDPKVARPLNSKVVRNLVRKLLWKLEMRSPDGHHEFKQVHGFRKFFKTQAERVMKTIDVEKLLGHTENYYKPGRDYLLQEYRRAVPYLTINESVLLRDELKKKNEENYKKVGELEQINLGVQERLAQMEGQIKELTELLANRTTPS